MILFAIFLPQYLRCFQAFLKFAGVITITPGAMYFYSIVETYPILLIPLIRLNEPIIKKVLKEVFCCSKKTKRTKYKYIEGSLFAFLNS